MEWRCDCINNTIFSSSLLRPPAAATASSSSSSSALPFDTTCAAIGLHLRQQVRGWCNSEEYKLENKKELDQKLWPFWRKRKNSSYELRALTRRIVSLTKRRQLNEIFELVTNAKKEKWKINRITLNAVLEACVHCLDLDRAFQVYKDMLQPGGCGVDAVTYGILLKGLGDARRLDEAFELLESMEAGTAPGKPEVTAMHLNTLVNACASAGEALRARGALIRYRPLVSSIGPSILTYNLLIKGYSRSGNPLEALKVREEMHMHGLKPDRLTYNSLILACVRGGDIDSAMHIVQEMKEEARKMNTSELLPDVISYTTLIKGLAESGNFQSLLNMIDEMKAATNFTLDRVAYTSMIDALVTAGLPIDALDYLTELEKLAEQDRQFKPRAHAYLALMRAFAESGDVSAVADLKQRMSSKAGGNISPENRQEANELLIEAATTAKEIELAKDVLRHLAKINSSCHLSYRGCLAIIRLQALSNFEDNIFSPFMLKKQVSLQDSIGKVMLSYPQVKPLPGNLQLGNVVMRFFNEDVIPIVDQSENCIGVVHSGDCFKIDARLSDIMRGPPPTVSSSASVEKALSLLLEAKVDLLTVVSANCSLHSSQLINQKVIGFLRRTDILQLRTAVK